jgi:hypothetical protein
MEIAQFLQVRQTLTRAARTRQYDDHRCVWFLRVNGYLSAQLPDRNNGLFVLGLVILTTSFLPDRQGTCAQQYQVSLHRFSPFQS